MRRLLVLGLLLISSRAFSYEMEDVQQIQFEIRDPKTDEVYFTGREDITHDGKNSRRETRYFDKDKNEVETESAVYDRDSLKTSAYEFKSMLTGEESRMTSVDNEAKIFYKESSQKKSKEATLKLERNSFHGKVVNYLILRNWKALTSGKIYKFHLIVPERQETIPFQLAHKRSYQKDGENREVFALIPQNVLIRTLAPHLEFEFSGGDRPLAKQVLCPSPLPIKGQDDKMIYFTFNYPDLGKAGKDVEKDKEKEKGTEAPPTPNPIQSPKPAATKDK